MKKLYFIFSILILTNIGIAQSIVWSKRFGTALNETGFGVAVDAQGNVHMAGVYRGPGFTMGNTGFSHGGSDDIFYGKFNGNGQLLSTAAFNGSGIDQVSDLAVTSNSNAIIVGNTTVNGNQQALVNKITNPNGWTVTFGGSDLDAAQAVACYQNKIIVCGFFNGTMTVGSNTLVSAGGSDVFVVTLDSTNGNYLSAFRVGGAGNEIAYGLDVDGNGNILITGTFSGETNLNGSTNLTSVGNSDVFIAKYSAQGVNAWYKNIGNGQFNRAYDIRADINGNVIATGYANSATNFGGGNIPDAASGSSAYIVKYSVSGTYQWAKMLGTEDAIGRALDVDATGNIYATITFQNTINFGGGNINAINIRDIAIVKYNAAGDYMNALGYGGEETDESTKIAITSNNDVIVCGSIRGNILMGPSILDHAGANDALLTRFTLGSNNQVITFDPLSTVTVGAPDFQLIATSSAGLPVSFSSSNSAVASVIGNTVNINAVGTTTITAFQNGSGNISAAIPVARTLTVTREPQSIVFPAIPDQFVGDPSYELEAYSTSGLSITYFSDNEAVALISSGSVIIMGPGTANIQAVQNGNNFWAPAAAVTQTITVLSEGLPGAVFRVNMSTQTVSPLGVFLSGSFNNWSTTANPMTNIGGGIYETTVSMDPLTNFTYKFVNGTTYENVNGNCTINDGNGNFNRFGFINNTLIELPTVCFGSCTNCVGSATLVTFQVDMSQQSVSPDGVFLAGSFNGFSTTANEMTALAGGIYETTIALPANAQVTYKFVNGSTFELINGNCTQNDGGGNFNRFYNVTSTNADLPVVCFNSCSACVTGTSTLTFQVNMSEEIVAPEGVFLSGSFNSWSTTANPMTNTGNGIYTTTIEVEAGQTIAYKFVNGNVYEVVNGSCTVDDGFGNFNRIYTTNATDVTLPLVCYESCSNCATTLQPVDVTFQVNMSQQTVNPAGVFVSGTFNNWSLTANPMTTLGNGIYTATVAIPQGLAISYKFVNGTEYELLQGPCTILGGESVYDRADTIGNTDITLPLVCWGSCDNCPNPTLTFRVDMSQQTVAPTGVFLAGTFNNWSIDSEPLTNIGNGIYSVTVEFEAGTPISYKFVNGTEYELLQGPCTILGGQSVFDRVDTVGFVSEVLPIVCWGSCSACTTAVNTVDVTFTVNMLPVGAEPEGVFLAGNFNGYSTTATPMTTSDNNIYTVTVAIPENTLTMYKFVNGIFFEDVVGNCTMNDGSGNFNRFFTTTTNDLNLPTVCYAACVDCGPVGIANEMNSNFNIYPNPTNGNIQLECNQVGTARIVAMTGQIVHQQNVNAGVNLISIDQLSAGIYMVQLQTEQGIELKKLVKN